MDVHDGAAGCLWVNLDALVPAVVTTHLISGGASEIAGAIAVATVAIGRTLADYWINWKFYFPRA